MFFKQIKDKGDNFSYIIADKNSKNAIVVDTSYNADIINKLVEDLKLSIKYIINTHHHRDHTAGNNQIRSRYNSKIIAHKYSNIEKDIEVTDGYVLRLGDIKVTIIHTPGHTRDSICILTNGKILTGDTLFVGECGRTDLPDGSSEEMYHSLFHKLMNLDDDIEVYPGHDYGSSPYSTILKEKKVNYTLEKRTLDEFIDFMKE
jgi:glyoxylase-like metal-dependent hydrolase (beta-lactamase superfamily II)